MDIQELRAGIDAVDNQIRDLFTQRMDLSSQIADYKRSNKLPILDRTREREILARLTADQDPDLANYTRMLFKTLFDMSRAYQSARMGESQQLEEQIKSALEASPRKLPQNVTVACQGVEGAYSQIACDKLFASAGVMFMDSFEGVARAVGSGLCDYGILPIENNLYGSVNEVYDLMRKHSFYIVRSIKLRINHSLVVKPGTTDGDIREIFSHEQAIGQCSEFLKKYPNAKVTICENTAMAAKHVAQSDRSDVAAICSAECSELYGLKQLHRDIQNSDNNYTRFICIAKDLQILEGVNKVSILFRVPHRPGSLYEVLSTFATVGVNVSKLESRPIPGHDFDFLFYADVDADCREEQTVKMLCDLTRCTEEMTFLGAYSEA
ncbi:bifunctional chorismate mutase/prephenate dehydratase [Oscillibacter hominis]|uniref:Bifunctional chorismate mutase/prephenate dehydratase n=1 Tax=Oscillibacter hominis TaxID=2763056 RepID=A0A7G9B422_9FIRM|nr:bifunctional chorismate mutase/prephenate dehydratase [Oscillibacter hominis]QNL44303.1 bifunctional chorismate mutase/prephenate dehydratase [Oscillibacter hominis]